MSFITSIVYFFRRSLYHAKYAKEVQNFPKLLEVVMSCETPEQCTTAMHYIQLYKRQTIIDNTGFGQGTIAVLGQLIDYLQDTAEHVRNGYHKPAYNDYKTVTTYPDMNDYVGTLLTSLRFAKAWTRGKSSVIMIDNN